MSNDSSESIPEWICRCIYSEVDAYPDGTPLYRCVSPENVRYLKEHPEYVDALCFAAPWFCNCERREHTETARQQ